MFLDQVATLRKLMYDSSMLEIVKENKLLAGVLAAVLVLVVGLLYFRFYSSQTALTQPVANKISGVNSTLESRVTSLEDAVALLINRVNNLGNIGSSGGSTDRISSLETTVASLQIQLNQLKQTGATTGIATTGVATSGNVSGKQVTYIPLNWVGSATTTDWSSVTTQSIVIDPADFPGYTSMQFEANLQVYQGNGTAYARILDNTDGLAAISSQVSTTAQNYTWVSSSSFQLPSTAKKTYVLQLKTSSSYAASVDGARIKVSF